MSQPRPFTHRHHPDQDVVYVAARAPRPGFTKTRLGAVIGHEAATALYRAFVQDLAQRLEHLPWTTGWYITPDDAWSDLAPLIPATRATDRPRRVLAQPPGDWTERQRALFATAADRHERRTVLIASDSPHLEAGLLTEAFERLQRDNLVLGPTDDGGYYLIGMRTADNARTPDAPATRRPWDALAGVRMSTGTVLDEILTRAAALGLGTSLLPATFDIDEADDLQRLIPLARVRDDLAATRAVLEHLGLIAERPAPAAFPPAAGEALAAAAAARGGH